MNFIKFTEFEITNGERIYDDICVSPQDILYIRDLGAYRYISVSKGHNYASFKTEQSLDSIMNKINSKNDFDFFDDWDDIK